MECTWPPYLTGHMGFVLMMNQLCRGIIETVHAIRDVHPDSIMVHVDASKKYIHENDSLIQETVLWNEIRFLMWDLIQGLVTQGHPLYKWLLDRGLSRDQLTWFEKCSIHVDIIGVNYYPQFSVNLIHQGQMEDEKIPEVVHGSGQELIDIVQDTYARYNKPIFITETSYRGSVEERIRWMNELDQACTEIVEKGIDLFGVTWFPFISMIEWEYRTNNQSVEANIAPFGLYDLKISEDGILERIPNDALKRYMELIQRT